MSWINARAGAMDRDQQIRAAQERLIDVYSRKPSAALSTVRATGHIDEGLTCKFRQGKHELIKDSGKVLGGDEKGLSPGFFSVLLLFAVLRLASNLRPLVKVFS